MALEQLEEGFRGKRGSKESLLVDVAAKNLLKTLVATFCRASCCFFPTSPDEFSTWASRCCLPADPASCELWWPHDCTSSLSLRIVLYHNIILYFSIRNIICTDRAKARCSTLNLIRFNTHQLNLSMCPLGAACMWVTNMQLWWLLDPAFFFLREVGGGVVKLSSCQLYKVQTCKGGFWKLVDAAYSVMFELWSLLPWSCMVCFCACVGVRARVSILVPLKCYLVHSQHGSLVALSKPKDHDRVNFFPQHTQYILPASLQHYQGIYC